MKNEETVYTLTVKFFDTPLKLTPRFDTSSHVILTITSNHGREIKHNTVVVKIGGNENLVVTSTVVLPFLFIVES